MTRTLLYSLTAVTAISVLALASRSAISAGQSGALVRLQPTTPGVQQIGNVRIYGAMIASTYEGETLELDTAGNRAIYAKARANSANAIVGEAIANGGYGVLGVHSGVGVGVGGTGQTGGGFTGVFEGVFGNATSTAFDAVGVRGRADGPFGTGVEGTAFSNTGATFGGYFYCQSSAGTGLLGYNGATTGTPYGGRFIVAAPSGRALYAYATSTTGTPYAALAETEAPNGRALYGICNTTSTTGLPYAVRGVASTATLGYAVFATGDMGASGVKPFRIDHPQDPLNKYLLHYAAESPFPQNFYTGMTTTDSKGYAWIELPSYFSEINTNLKYQLTVVDTTDSDEFIWAKVVKKVENNRFRIRSNKPGVEVSWEVKADRNDARIQVRRPTDVMDKVGAERGKYQHPEYFGAPAELGMDYQR